VHRRQIEVGNLVEKPVGVRPAPQYAAGVPVADRASGCWNLLSGAVQALMMRDVLDSAMLHRLLDPVVTGLAG